VFQDFVVDVRGEDMTVIEQWEEATANPFWVEVEWI
jgi:hypothetical protein